MPVVPPAPVTFSITTCCPNAFDIAQATAGKTVAIFGLPGAFTPTCSTFQLPGFEKSASEMADLGVDDIYCLSVNDSFVMNQWAKAQGLDNVKVIPDGSGEFTQKVGMLVRKDNLGFGPRSWRYAAIIDDGVVEAVFEDPDLKATVYAEIEPYLAEGALLVIVVLFLLLGNFRAALMPRSPAAMSTTR